VPETRVRINMEGRNCEMSLNEIFEYNKYDLSNFPSASDLWLKPTKQLQVMDANNKLQNITNLYINGNADVYEVPFSDGTTVKCTAEHKFKLADGTWKRADELDEGDEIMQY